MRSSNVTETGLLPRSAVSYETAALVSCVSSPPPILASAYTPRRHLRLRPEPSAHSRASLSLNQRLVRESLSGRPIYEAIEPCQGVILDVSFVQPERKFVNVAVKMLRASVMVHTDQAALQDSKNAFNPVRRYTLAHVFARSVVHGIMDKATLPIPEYGRPSPVCKVDPVSTCR